MFSRNVIIRKYTLALVIFCIINNAKAQNQLADSSLVTIAAGPQYLTSRFQQRLWGKHYRTDWSTPVKIKLFYLDTAAGGLIPYQAGGGRQSKTVRLHDTQQREYVLRSIDKTFGGALPDIYQNTFVENVINDQVSIAEPYAALTIPQMAEAAGIYHTWPQIVFVPQQKALDSFNAEFGNRLYLFEQRPDENWEDAPNFGSSKNIISTEKVLEKISEDGSHRVDQLLFVRSRLFDIFIGDWGRHEDQWRWATTKQGDKTIYKPIPRDRDQAYTKFDGVLLKVAKAAAGAAYLQSFDYTIKDVRGLNYPARNLDRRMANETTLQQWNTIAKELQLALTDDVITASVRQMPPEVYANTGTEIITKLKSRRNDLVKYATDYYLFLAHEVDITGTKDVDYFLINNLPDGKVSIDLFRQNSLNKKESEPFYSRTFLSSETKEIRVYGLAGKDSYEVKGEKNDIVIRLIGGDAEDEYRFDPSSGVHVYDSKNQLIKNTPGTHLHLSGDSSIHVYHYEAFRYSKKGLSPTVFYNDDDRLFIGLAYKITTQPWRKQPYGQKHIFYSNYSVTQKAFNFGYTGIYNQVIGNWRAILLANYDLVKWRNFFGLGNETVKTTNNADYYRMRSTEALLSLSFEHVIGKQSSISIAPFYQYIKILRDDNRYLAKEFLNGSGQSNFTSKNFVGARAALNLQRLNNLLFPTKGITFSTSVIAAKNVAEAKHFINYAGDVQFYLPFFKHFILSVKNGAATVIGEPEFYQLNNIGGSLLRGYRSQRFWGETVFYNNNELHYLFNVRSFLFNGKMGILGLADQGRVWKKGEVSGTWHYGYGGGIIAVPFNKLYVSLQYGISKEHSQFYLDFRTSL